MVQAAAQDYADNNIRINTLIPGTTDTEFVRRAAGMMNAPDPVWQAAVSVWAKSNVAVAHRLARPEEIAATALMIASDEFTVMNSAQIVVDGGKTAHARTISPGWSEGPDPESRDSGFALRAPRNDSAHPISRSTASPALRSSAVSAACGRTGSPTSYPWIASPALRQAARL